MKKLNLLRGIMELGGGHGLFNFRPFRDEVFGYTERISVCYLEGLGEMLEDLGYSCVRLWANDIDEDGRVYGKPFELVVSVGRWNVGGDVVLRVQTLVFDDQGCYDRWSRCIWRNREHNEAMLRRGIAYGLFGRGRGR